MFSRDLPNGQTLVSADFLRGKGVETAGWRVVQQIALVGLHHADKVHW